MRVMLIYSPYRYPHAYAMRTELLGITYLAACLRNSRYDVAIFDPTIHAPIKLEDGSYYYGISDNNIRDAIGRYAPDVVGISCHYAYSHHEAFRVAELAKEVNPDITTVMGGLYPSIYKEKSLLGSYAVDYGLVGEGEKSLLDLLHFLATNSLDVGQVDGLLYKHKNEVIYNTKCHFIEDLDQIPYPARDMVDIHLYMNSGTVLYGLGNRPSLSIITSRSCPNRCSFCNMWLVQGPRWRARSPENVLGEIDELVNKYKAEHVFVMDDNFNLDPERVKIICEGIIRKSFRFKWNTPNGISAKRVDAEMAHLMKRAGCVNVCIGIESGSEYIRNDIVKKNVSNEEIEKAIMHFKSAKIPVGGFIIIGMLGEDNHQFEKTVAFIRRLPLSFIATTFAVPMPGTKLYQDLVNNGIIDEDFEIGIDNFNYPLFSTLEFSKQELLRRRKRLFNSFFFSHIPLIFKELLAGQLTWIKPDMLKRFLSEKIFNNCPLTYL